MKMFSTLMNRGKPAGEEEKRLMLEMENIGKKIASLRKESNRTQQDLADQLGVTYQAVSNWERGLSIPDVLRLKDLARLFEVSLDELLGNEAAVRVVEVASGDRPPGNVKELLLSAPYMKPRTLENEIRARTQARTRAKNGEASPKPGPAHGSAPPSEDAAASPAREEGKAAGPFEEPDWMPDRSAEEAPHPVEGEQLPAEEAGQGSSSDASDQRDPEEAEGSHRGPLSLREILAFAPFVSSDLISELVRQEMDEDPDFDCALLTPRAPFLEMQHLKELALHLLQGSPAGAAISEQTLVSLLPHLDPSTLNELARHVILRAEGSPRVLIQLAPFLDRKTLGQLVQASDERVPLLDSTVIQLAPFLDSRDLSSLAAAREPLSRLLRTSLMPFLQDSDMATLARDLFGRKDRRNQDPEE